MPIHNQRHVPAAFAVERLLSPASIKEAGAAPGEEAFKVAANGTVLTSLTDLEKRLVALTTDVTHDEALGLLQLAEVTKGRAAELAALAQRLALAWVLEHGPLVCGSIRYEALRS